MNADDKKLSTLTLTAPFDNVDHNNLVGLNIVLVSLVQFVGGSGFNFSYLTVFVAKGNTSDKIQLIFSMMSLMVVFKAP